MCYLIRAELVKRWVDVRRVLINTIDGTVYLKGTIVFLGMGDIENPSHVLSIIERDLKKLRGVKDIRFELINWIKSGDGWKEIRLKVA